MDTIIEQYRKELLQLAIYQDDTAKNYISCIYKYIGFANNHLNIEPFKTTPQHLKQWMMHLKKNDISNSRMTHSAKGRTFRTNRHSLASLHS